VRIAWKASTKNREVASIRYRVLKPVELLSNRGHQVEIFDLDRVDLYDAVVFCKSYGPGDQSLATKLRRAGKRVIFDTCDNHFYNPYDLEQYEGARANQLRMIELSDLVVCSTPALARVVRREARLEQSPAVVGDVVEVVDLPASGERPVKASLIWFGSHGSPNAPAGMLDLLQIAPKLEAAARRHEFELVVVSNNREKFDRSIAPLAFEARYVPWSPAEFSKELAAASAVLIPLSDNPFVACKTHNRLTLALAARKPVIADAIESYREFAPYVWLSDWDAALEAVLGAEQGATQARLVMAQAYLDAYWSEDEVARAWERALGLRPSAPPSQDEGRGGLVQFSDRSVFGWVDEGAANGAQVELMANGRPVASGPADLPRSREEGSVVRRICSTGAFHFTGGEVTTALTAEGGPYIRCTARMRESGRPIPGAVIDLYEPA
jgi:hypothetical protein